MFEMIDLYRLYTCESGDIKKTDNIERGSILHETDTRLKYIFNGTAWVVFADTINLISTTNKNTTNLVTIDTTFGGVTIASANPKRVNIFIQNQGAQPILISFGEDTSITNYNSILTNTSELRIGDGGAYETSTWKGSIKGLTEIGSSIVSIFEEVVI